MLGMFILLAFLAVGLVSCGGKSSGNSGSPGTTTGNYTITVSGASGSITQTTTITLTVN
jgi:ABC-type Fe3+-hydroxamate transport system substrate-binding protein